MQQSQIFSLIIHCLAKGIF